MADQKITDYTALTTPAAEDLIEIIDDPSGTPVNKKITRENFFNNGLVVNEAGAAVDFRVEGDTDANLLFVNGSTDRVGIGTSSPEEKFDVLGNFKVRDLATETKAYRFRTSGGALDLEAGGQSLYLSMWSNADFTGTQYNQFILRNDGSAIEFFPAVVFNNDQADKDFHVKGDTEDNVLFVDASANSVGIGTATPSAKLDVNSDVLRLRSSKTPASASATGNQGDIAWDTNYIYVCTASNTWKRAALNTW